jgi:hypothetical protein
MRQSNFRGIAIVGVLVTAVMAALLVMPASRQLGTTADLWVAAAIMGIPTMAVLVVTSFRYYGLPRSVAVAAVIAAVTCVVSLVVAAFAFASALSGSATGLLLAVVLFGAPALTVAVLGLSALRLAPAERSKAREHEPVG